MTPQRPVAKLLQKVIFGILMSVAVTVLSNYLHGSGFHSKSPTASMVEISNAPSWNEVGGMKSVKEELWYNVVVPLRFPHLFFGGKKSCETSRGVMMLGPPGTGKTMIVRAAAKEAGATFISPTLADLERKYYGETSQVLQNAFDTAVKCAPSIIFFDEVDGACRTRQAEEGCTYGLKTEMLRQIDSLPKDAAVIVIGCTNVSSAVDPALKRRLPVKILVDLPTSRERREILKILCGDEDKLPNVIDGVVKETSGFSGSDLAALYRAVCSCRLRRVIGRSFDGVEARMQKLPPLLAQDWTAALRSVQNGRREAEKGHLGQQSATEKLGTILSSLAKGPAKNG